jgi:3-oxoacyl-[acyl-carrier protein] reductase
LIVDSPETKRLQGKRAVVTGSTTGIGREIALEFARQGADVIIHGRAESDNSRTVIDEIQSLGQNAGTVFQDFSKPYQAETLVDEAWNIHGQVDIWVNNAGADVLTGNASEWTFQQKLAHLFKTDVESTLLLSRAAGKRLKESTNMSSGAIVNIGWDQAYQGMAGDSGQLFATTKGAIMSMTKSLAQTLAPKVRVNCVAAGWIQTKWGNETSSYWNDRASRESLMNRWGQPSDIAKTVGFLCSDEASFICGQIINVNGGFNFAGEQ